MNSVEVVAVRAEVVRPLRQAVLRPHQRVEDIVHLGDDAESTLHAAVLEDGGPIGTATIMVEPHPRQPAEGDWRVRGMATKEEVRGRGIATALLETCLAHARDHGGRRVWCNARPRARTLYERAGFRADGAPFDVPELGPHLLMSAPLR